MTKTHQPPFEPAPPTRKNPVVVTKKTSTDFLRAESILLGHTELFATRSSPAATWRADRRRRLKFAVLPGVSGGKIQGIGQ